MIILNKITNFFGGIPLINRYPSQLPTETTKANLLVKKTLESQGNGDFILTKERSRLYCTVDSIGGARQVAATVQAATMLTHTASAVASIAGSIIPLGLLITGPLVMGSTSVWAIPDSHAALKDANEELKAAGDNPTLIEEAKHAISIAKLGIANMYLTVGMGAAQTASGLVMMLTPDVARVFHYTPILAGHAATVALAATNIALGAAYAIRGAVMLTRTIKAYLPVIEMRNKFEEALKQSPHEALEFLEKEEKNGSIYFERRVDPGSLDLHDDKGDVTGQYTAKGIINGFGKLIDDSVEAKREYLRRVDKGIHTQTLKHRVALIIGGAMVLGGITAIVLSVLTGGILPIVIALASAIFFISMEYLFLVYDSTAIFNKLRDWTYTPNTDLANLDKTLPDKFSIYQAATNILSYLNAA